MGFLAYFLSKLRTTSLGLARGVSVVVDMYSLYQILFPSVQLVHVSFVLNNVREFLRSLCEEAQGRQLVWQLQYGLVLPCT